MRIRNHIGESGKSILEYIPENDADREKISAMMRDGKIPNAPSQRVPENRGDDGKISFGSKIVPLVPMEEAIQKFIEAIALAGIQVPREKIKICSLSPHEPTNLPRGKMAVYCFRLGDHVLKIGKVGRNSNARFRTQHYIPKSSKSNLAKSLLADETGPCPNLNEENIGAWMKEKLDRTDILLDGDLSIEVLTFLESFLQCCYSPKYEGFKSQRS